MALLQINDRIYSCGQASDPVPMVFPAVPFVMPWLPLLPLPTETAIAHPAITGWFASTELVQTDADLSLLQLADQLEQQQIPFCWAATPGLEIVTDWRILAIVPHFECEPWLERCLRSLVQQSRPLDRIVVVDDHSPQPPSDIVARFPQVTLLRSPETVGPYRLVQQVIDTTDYDAYLFQDADDWSSCDRLALLLQTMLDTGADLVGTQELRVLEDGQLLPVSYPLDVNAALRHKPGHPLLHPTSLVTRRLVQAAGGFATGLRFGGDTEFLLRSHHLGKCVNIPHYCYYRRKRAQSLTTRPDTGLESPARLALLQQLKQRAIEAPHDLKPIAIAPPIKLDHILGPSLC
jgi:hypothetical protein